MSCKSKEVNNTTCLQYYKLIDLFHYELKPTEPTKGGMPLAEADSIPKLIVTGRRNDGIGWAFWPTASRCPQLQGLGGSHALACRVRLLHALSLVFSRLSFQKSNAQPFFASLFPTSPPFSLSLTLLFSVSPPFAKPYSLALPRPIRHGGAAISPRRSDVLLRRGRFDAARAPRGGGQRRPPPPQEYAALTLSLTHPQPPRFWGFGWRLVRALDKVVEAARTDGGIWALQLAAGNEQLEVCHYLVEGLRVDVNAADDEGRTPLVFAVIGENAAIVKYLLDHGADPDKADDDGLTPLHSAAGIGDCEMIEMLLAKGADIDPAVNVSSVECVKLLVEAGADVNSDCISTAALDSAMGNDGSTECLNFLMEAGANYGGPNDFRVYSVCGCSLPHFWQPKFGNILVEDMIHQPWHQVLRCLQNSIIKLCLLSNSLVGFLLNVNLC
uniref:Uncharacterized protein n=1 Tax=Oryza rufipogon TaxID=4529 RepID=A0A0E0QFZ2_ORYRU